jgi:hypothetical protein
MLMDQIVALSPYLLGAVIIIALLNIMRTLLRDDNAPPDFDSDALEMAEQEEDPYLRQYNLFLAELESLPEEYAQYIDLDKPSPITIPARVPLVGDLDVRFAGQLIEVTIGKHTKQRFSHRYAHAGAFILGVLTNQYVFHIYNDRVNIYERGDFLGPEDANRDFYVWSGRLLDQMLADGL